MDQGLVTGLNPDSELEWGGCRSSTELPGGMELRQSLITGWDRSQRTHSISLVMFVSLFKLN